MISLNFRTAFLEKKEDKPLFLKFFQFDKNINFFLIGLKSKFRINMASNLITEFFSGLCKFQYEKAKSTLVNRPYNNIARIYYQNLES